MKKLNWTIVYLALFMKLHAADSEFLAHLQTLPKSELHLHLSGSYPKQYLDSIASFEQRAKLETALTQVSQGVDYHQVFAVFQLVNQIIDTEEKVFHGVRALCAFLKEDGVTYAEIRSGLKNLGRGTEAYLKAILDGIEKENSHNFEARLLLSLQRNSSPSVAQETIDLALTYQDRGVIGIDLSGDSTMGDIDLILPEFLRAKEEGLPFVIHIGESPKEQDQMKLLTTLNPVRVGHGAHLCPEAANWISSHQIPLEICLTSSVLVRMVERFDQHPGLHLFRKGHPIAFCTDDPLLFSTSLSHELFLAHKEAGLSAEEVERAAVEAWRYKINHQ
jgi:adenosine deaminase